MLASSIKTNSEQKFHCYHSIFDLLIKGHIILWIHKLLEFSLQANQLSQISRNLRSIQGQNRRHGRELPENKRSKTIETCIYSYFCTFYFDWLFSWKFECCMSRLGFHSSHLIPHKGGWMVNKVPIKSNLEILLEIYLLSKCSCFKLVHICWNR